MSVTIRLPELSPNMERATIVRWFKREGDDVAVGDVLAEVETDKATMEMEAMDSGVLDKILVPDGTQEVAVNAPIAILVGGTGGDATPSNAPDAEPKPAALGLPDPEPTAMRTVASPFARKLARQLDVELGAMAGSGPGGRIIAADVRSAEAARGGADDRASNAGAFASERLDLAGAPRAPGQEQAALAYREAPVDGFRRAAARNLSASKRDIPHFRVTADIECDAALALRASINECAPDLRLTFNDFIIRAVARTLEEAPEINTIWANDKLLRFAAVDIGIAVSAGERLYAPVIRDVSNKTISLISKEVRRLAERARAGSLSAREIEGGATAISNLGMFSVKSFDAIINPPHSSIFAIGQAQPRAIVRDGSVAVATMATVTISCDHRVIDGAQAARALERLKSLIEQPLLLIV